MTNDREPVVNDSAQMEWDKELLEFKEFGTETHYEEQCFEGKNIPIFINEFWTSKQRACASIHEISYRACFKPQLPRFFIERLTDEGALVYDPFMGRGTTLMEAGLMGRKLVGNDINPLSRILIEPRLNIPSLNEVEERLGSFDLEKWIEVDEELFAFYHPLTLTRLTNLREYFLTQELDNVDRWIRMVAMNRLTGHSSGFFSVYTMPPNQAVSVESQLKINAKRNQSPPVRDVKAIILKKSKALLNRVRAEEMEALANCRSPQLFTGNAAKTPLISDGSVKLVVTSPPFLDVVDYQKDNWLRCWFNGLNASEIPIWQLRKPEDWISGMTKVFCELKRVLADYGNIAFEVGEVRGGKLKMEELVIPAAVAAGLKPIAIVVNAQKFTKTSNCWGVSNAQKGTNTNRVILLRKAD